MVFEELHEAYHEAEKKVFKKYNKISQSDRAKGIVAYLSCVAVHAKFKECPLCKSSKSIELKDISISEEGALKQVSVRLYCFNCKKAMTVTGPLVSTVKKVEG